MNHYVTYDGNRFLNPLLDELFGIQDALTSESNGSLSMRTDIRKEKDGYLMSIDLPGIKKENIAISYEDGRLAIKVHVNTIEKDESGNPKPFLRRERFSGSASRSYFIGDVDEKSIKAEYQDGVLRLFIPEEKQEEETVHSIKIQ